jgi:hypothetical protein
LEKKRYKFNDFSELWGEEMGRGRMSWMGKGDWVVIGTVFAALIISQGLDCYNVVELPQPWVKYFFVLAGCIWLAGGVIRFLVPAWRRPLPGLFMPGYAFCTVGIVLIYGWRRMWPLIGLAVAIFITETVIYNHFRKKMLAEKEREDS